MALASLVAWDNFRLNHGYSFSWLMLLYILGAVIRLHVPQLPRLRWCVAAAFLLPVFTSAQLILFARVPELAEKLRGRALANEFISPVTVLTAVAWLMACLQLRVKSARVKAALAFGSTSSFGVYLLHVHPMFFDGVLRGSLRGLSDFGNRHALIALAGVLALSVLLYVVCAIIEKVRRRVFRV